VLYLPVSATLQGIGDDPVVVRNKRGFVPLRKTSKNRIWDCGLLGSTHRIVFGGEKSWKQLRSSRGTRHDDDDDDDDDDDYWQGQRPIKVTSAVDLL